MASKTLSAGFTGEMKDPTTLSARAKAAADGVRDEAALVATHATDHPVASGSALAVVAMAAFAFGYALASSRNGIRARW
jgi:hypothetical protein